MLPHLAAPELVEVGGTAYLVRTELVEKHIVIDPRTHFAVQDAAGEIVEECTYRCYHVRAERERPYTAEEIPEFDD
jgi:hypothetical protein